MNECMKVCDTYHSSAFLYFTLMSLNFYFDIRQWKRKGTWAALRLRSWSALDTIVEWWLYEVERKEPCMCLDPVVGIK